jgi:hypothetical protein
MLRYKRISIAEIDAIAWKNAAKRRRSDKAKAAVAKSLHAKKVARDNAAMKEILAVYKPGWISLPEQYRGSLASIARALSWFGYVRAHKSESSILPLLKRLNRAGKIKLPGKKRRRAKKAKARRRKK